jgi:hypothetical protein
MFFHLKIMIAPDAALPAGETAAACARQVPGSEAWVRFDGIQSHFLL